MQKDKIPSIGKIVLWFIIFYPVGFYFLFKRIRALRLQEEYSRIVDSGAVETFQVELTRVTDNLRSGSYTQQTAVPQSSAPLGRKYKNIALAEVICGVIFSASGLGMLISRELPDALVSIGISLVLICLAYRRNLKITKYQTYLNYLNSYDATDIPSIARFVCREEITVRNDLMDMIGCKMIDAKLTEDGQVILAGATGSRTVRAVKKKVTCPYCGAPTTVYTGKKNTCEYCGLSIEE